MGVQEDELKRTLAESGQYDALKTLDVEGHSCFEQSQLDALLKFVREQGYGLVSITQSGNGFLIMLFAEEVS